MIGRLQGILIEKQPPHLLINVNGVGYEVQASLQTCFQLPDLHQEIILHTQFIVREDAQLLFGFYTKHERALFRNLLKVNGVGPKLALAILSSVTPDEFIHCINSGDSASLVRLPGVGKKTAERLMIEMRDRLTDFKNQHNEFVLPAQPSAHQEAMSALISLGYKPQEAVKALQNNENTDNKTSQELIRLALKRL